MIHHMNWWSAAQYERFREEIVGDFEDDALGVYEVWWTANTTFPDRAVSERLAVAEAVVTDLVATGSARLYRGQWIGPSHERTSVSAEQVAGTLREWATWVPQEGDVVWMDKSR